MQRQQIVLDTFAPSFVGLAQIGRPGQLISVNLHSLIQREVVRCVDQLVGHGQTLVEPLQVKSEHLVTEIDLARLEKVVQVEGVTIAQTKKVSPGQAFTIAMAGVPMPFSTDLFNVVGIPAAGEMEKFKALVPGRKVRMVGFVHSTASELGMLNCTVTDLGAGSEPTPVRMADEVTAEFAKDEVAARKKYGLSDDVPAVMLLRGKVTESATNGDTGTVRVDGTNGFSVSFEMKVTKYTKPPEISKTVTVVGLFEGYDAKSKTLKLRFTTVIPY